MATLYTLICWGGKDGLSVTVNASTDYVGLTYNGTKPTGTQVQFISGTLPSVAGTALALNTTYYAKYIDISNFELYYDSGLSSKINFTAAGSSLVMRGALYAAHNLSGALARYTVGGVVHAYHGIGGAHTFWAGAGVSSADDHVWEIDDDFVEEISSGISTSITPQSLTITTKINGVRSPRAWHGGVYGAGFILRGHSGSTMTALSLGFYRMGVDGFSISHDSYGAGSPSGISLYYGSTCDNMIFQGRGKASSGIGIALGSVSNMSVARNNLVLDWAYGIRTTQYVKGMYVANNTVSNCTNGFSANATSSLGGFFYNNVALGNTTNWQATYGGLEGASNNVGLSGEPWYTTGGSQITGATSDFASYSATSSAADFKPAAAGVLVDAGITYYDPIAADLSDAERPNYNNGGSETYDCGCYEYDHGYGTHPASQTYTVSGVTLGRIKIAKQSDGSEIYNDTTLPSAEASTFGSNTPVYIYIRKGSSAPYYHPLKLAATIDVDTGLDYDATGLQQEDIAAHDYSGTAVASDWSFDLGTGAITHDSGTTRYSVQDLYSWHQDYTDGSTQIDDDPLMHGTTPHIFELINSGDISDADLQDLYGGSIEFVDGTLWSNIYQAGTLTGTPPIYLVQNGSKVSSFWADGSLDVLVKVANAGTLIDSGLVDAYVRTYGYTYAYYQVDASAGGSNVAPLATLNYAVTQTINEATAATYSDVGYTFGSTSQDLGEGGGAATYYCRIDCAGRTLDQVAARTQYDCRDDSTTTLNSLEGWRYRKAHSSYAANDAAPFGIYSGGVWQVAQGVWLDNVATADQYNYILTDHAGTTHQLVASANQTVTVNGLAAGYRLQIYDTTSTTELYNDIVSGSSYTWTDSSSAVASRAIRVRIAYCTSSTAIQFVEAAIGTCGTTPTTKDVTYLAAIANDQVYIDNAVDGSAVAGVTFTDSTVDKMNIDISAGVDLQDLYAAWVYYAFTATGIATDIDYINAIDAANYVYSNLQWKNVTSPSVPLKISGGYAWDAATGDPMDLIDTTGGTIFLAPPHVVAKTITVSGSDVITGDISTVLAAIPSASTNASATRTNLATELAAIVRTEKWVRNKRTLDPATGMQRIYDDDGATVLGEGEAWLDADGAQPYDGSGAVHRTERLA